MFGMNETATSEYEITLDDLGGILKGEAHWRRDGIISDEAPEYVVARRNQATEKLACTVAKAAATSPAVATPASATKMSAKAPPKPAAKKQG